MATISIADSDARVQYTQAVTANSTTLTIDFPFFSLDDINVIVTSAAGVDTTLTRGTGTGTFAVNGTSVDDGFSGGNITLGDTYSDAATKFTIFRDIPVTRTTDFPTSGPFNISSLNTELDKIFAIEQELETKIGRTMKLADSDTAATLSLPNLDTRKGTVLAFNTVTGLPEAGPTIGDVSTVAAITSDIGLLADIQDGTTATNAITTVSGISSAVTGVNSISSAVSGVNSISSAVTSVNSNATNINKVAAIDSNVTTVAGIDSDVTTVAGIQSQITSVAADATDIGAVAGKATEIGRLGTADAVADLAILGTTSAVSDMNTLAGISTDITAVAGKASLITSDFVSDLNTLAVTDVINDINLLATSDIVADLNTLATSDIVSDLNTLATTDIVNDINTLATSDIVTDLNLLATSDFVADLNTMATSQNVSDLNSVAGSIGNVNTVASNITGVNSFGERYRVSASAPSTSLDVGDLWFDTANNIMKVYGSGGFANAGSSVNGTSERQDYVVGTSSGSYNGSTTVFPATYDAGFVDVYLNGIKLQPADFTATNGTSVTLGSAAQTNDTVSIVGYGTFDLSNFSIGDANNVDLAGLTNDQFLQYNSSSSNFEAVTIPDATTSASGFMSAADKTKLNGIEASADVTDATNVAAAGAAMLSGAVFTGDVTVDTDVLKVDTTNDRVGIGKSGPEANLHVIGNATDLNNSDNAMIIEGGDAGGNRGIHIGQIGDGTQARMFLQGFHSQAISNYWDLCLNPNGGNVTVGTDEPSLFNAEGTSAGLTVAGSDTSTTTTGNGGAAVNIVQTNGTAGNTAGLHFSRQDTDGTPNYSGASIVAQFPDAQATGQYPKGKLHFHTSTTANAAPSLKATLDELGVLTLHHQPFAAITINNPPAMTTSGGLHTTGSVQTNGGSCWNSSTHRFTASVAGNYIFTVTGYTTFTNQYGYISLYRNGSNYKTHHYNHNGHQQHSVGTLSMGIPLAVNDFLELRQGGAGTGHWQQLYLTIYKAT